MLCKILGRTVLVLAACAPLAPLAAADEAAVQGVWLKHERRVDYVGFTSLYSCDGLEDKLRLLLKAAGARDDIKIHTSCSNPFAGPSRIADAEVAFYALAPAAAAATAAGAAPPEPGVGVWKAVEFSEQRPYWLDPGDCELVEQFDRELLPLFTTRNHVSHMSCVPHQQTVGSIQVHFEALVPLPKQGPAPKPQ